MLMQEIDHNGLKPLLDPLRNPQSPAASRAASRLS
ncbi:hypothetical protein HNP49_003065 [Pseudomonas fluvialis]|uniref:Uncharacterized protein n=2 Tax=Pseudomonas fluvialis TaxID=1793966 RepID=A0A7X0BUE5_9PSED|nr:hypothetical protein [Pseudomonas fluvialis]